MKVTLSESIIRSGTIYVPEEMRLLLEPGRSYPIVGTGSAHPLMARYEITKINNRTFGRLYQLVAAIVRSGGEIGETYEINFCQDQQSFLMSGLHMPMPPVPTSLEEIDIDKADRSWVQYHWLRSLAGCFSGRETHITSDIAEALGEPRRRWKNYCASPNDTNHRRISADSLARLCDHLKELGVNYPAVPEKIMK